MTDETDLHPQEAMERLLSALEITPDQLEKISRQKAYTPPSPFETLRGEAAGAEKMFSDVEPFLEEEGPELLREQVPGYLPLKHLQRGEYGEAAETAALQALPLGRFVPSPVRKAALAGAAGMFGATTGESIGAESMFAAETDPVKRKAWEKQYREAAPRGQREILGAFNKQQAEIGRERRAEEARLGQIESEKKRRADWMAENAESIKSLKPAWQQEIQAAAGLPEAQTAFGRGMEERRKASETLAEAHPELVGALEVGGMALGAYLPGKFAARRSRILEQSVGEAKTAYDAGRKTESLREASDAAEKNLAKMIKLHQLGPGEIAGSVFLPWGFGQAPNFYDMTMGLVSSDPGAKEKLDKAWDNVLSLGPLERALLEGTVATGVGTLIGTSRKDFGAIKARGEGLLESLEARRAREAAKAAEKARKAADTRADKAATSGRASQEAARAAEEQERLRVSQATNLKQAYADKLRLDELAQTDPEAARKVLAATLQANQRKARARAPKRDVLKTGPLAGDDDVLEPIVRPAAPTAE